MRIYFLVLILSCLSIFTSSCSREKSPLENACKQIVVKQLELCEQSPISLCGDVISHNVFLEYPMYFTSDARVTLSRFCSNLCLKQADIKPTIKKAYELCISGKVFSNWFVRNKIKK